MTGAQILYPGEAAAVASASYREPLDAAFAAGDPPFKVVDGVIRLSTKEYNLLAAKYGSTWNWCQAYGLRLVTAHQLDGRVIEVVVEEMEAHRSRAYYPDGTEVSPDDVHEEGAGAKIIYSPHGQRHKRGRSHRS